MIKRLILLAILFITLPCYSATQTEVNKVINETKGLCNLYQKSCNITVVKYEGMVAQTRYGGEISISTGLINAMTEAQLRSVMFHEVGHVVLRHIEIKGDYLYSCNRNGNCNEKFLTELRREHEYQADRFSVNVTKYANMNGDLIGALLILTPPQDIHKTHDSHPSTADRINAIWEILNNE